MTFGPWPHESCNGTQLPKSQDIDFYDDYNDENYIPTIYDHKSSLRRSKRGAKLPCKKGRRLDKYVKQVLAFGKRYIDAQIPRPLPNATVDLPEYNILIFLYDGAVIRVSEAILKKRAKVMCGKDAETVIVTVQNDDIRMFYKYRMIKDWKLLFDGDMEIQILRARTKIQYSQRPLLGDDDDFKRVEQQRVEYIKILCIGAIRIRISGLGNLTQALSMWLTGYVNRNIDTIMYQYGSRIEAALKDAMNEQLTNNPLPVNQANQLVDY